MSATRVPPTVVRATPLSRESAEEALNVLDDPERVDRGDPTDQKYKGQDGDEQNEVVTEDVVAH
jgi:hypothetical protein